jgi:hypothetical protein
VIRRISVVHRRPELDRSEFLKRWKGEHAEAAARLEGLRSYVIYIPSDDAASFDGIAITTFDSRAAAERAFADRELASVLARTRDDFAASVEVQFVEEHTIVREEA